MVEQLIYSPKPTVLVKSIYFKGWPSHRSADADEAFKNAYCPVHNCITAASMKGADAVVFKEVVRGSRRFVPSSQVLILHLRMQRRPVDIIERIMRNAPYKTDLGVVPAGESVPWDKAFKEDSVNWTATYRSDSEIVTPYGKWVYYDEAVTSKEQAVNYAFGKTRKVAWTVSNCRASNRRMEFALELREHIAVDIYGTCGGMVCPKREIFDCYEIFAKRYKFYLSFENGNCIDYITEFFYNGLRFDVLPIVMGARPEDYRRVAPRHSYIHVVDFPDVPSLAAYLYRDDDLYNSYFAWKGTDEFINTHFFCRLCALLHAEEDGTSTHRRRRTYPDLRRWWRGPWTCVEDRWTDDVMALVTTNEANVTQNR